MPKANPPKAEVRLRGTAAGLIALALSIPCAADIAAGEANGDAPNSNEPPPKVTVSGSKDSGDVPLPQTGSGAEPGQPSAQNPQAPGDPSADQPGQTTAKGNEDSRSGRSARSGGSGQGPRVSVHTGIWDVIKGIFGGGGGRQGPPKPPKGNVPGSEPSGDSGTPGPQTGSIPGPQQPGSPNGRKQGKPNGRPDGTRPDGSPNGSPNGTVPDGAPTGVPGENRSVVLEDATKEFRKAQQRRRAVGSGSSPDGDAENDPWRKASASSSKAPSDERKTASAGSPGSRTEKASKPDAKRGSATGTGTPSPDDEFEKSLREFDGTILKERGIILARNTERARQGGLPPPPPEARDESEPAGGIPEKPDESRSGAGNMPNLPQREGDYKHTARRYTPPPDIPDGSDDDVFARQLREAAETEPDPELRKAMWEEYRRYKEGK